MRRALRLLLLVFTTLGTLVVGAMWATQYLPGFSYSEYIVDTIILDQKHGIKVSSEWAPLRMVSLKSSDGKLIVTREVTRIAVRTPGELRVCFGFGYSISTPELGACGGLWMMTEDVAPAERPRMIRTHYSVFAPIWFVFAVFALYPTIVVIRRLRMVRREGCCRQCGYDLTGNQSGVCPECGKAIRPMNV